MILDPITFAEYHGEKKGPQWTVPRHRIQAVFMWEDHSNGRAFIEGHHNIAHGDSGVEVSKEDALRIKAALCGAPATMWADSHTTNETEG